MMNKAALIRSDMLKNYENKFGKEKRQLLEMGTHSEQNEFDNKLKNEILNTLKQDYVDTKIMTNNKFQVEVGKWIDVI